MGWEGRKIVIDVCLDSHGGDKEKAHIERYHQLITAVQRIVNEFSEENGIYPQLSTSD